MLRLGRVKATALHFRGFIKNGHGPVATEFSLKVFEETLENRTITHPASLTWFFVIVVDNVDVVVIDADVPVLEVSLLVIVRLDRLPSTHHSFPENRFGYNHIMEGLIIMLKIGTRQQGVCNKTKSFPKSRQRSS